MQVDSYSGTLSSLLEGLGPRSSRGQADSSAQYAEISAEISAEGNRRQESAAARSGTSGATVAASVVAQSSSTVEQTVASASSSGTGSTTEQVTRTAEAAETAANASLSPPAASTIPNFAASSPQDPSPAAPWPVNIITPAIAPELASQSKSALAQAMTNAGLDPSQYKASYWEELVWYPGGNYTNRYITVQAPGGEKIDFDAAATLKSPHVTADILREHMTAAT